MTLQPEDYTPTLGPQDGAAHALVDLIATASARIRNKIGPETIVQFARLYTTWASMPNERIAPAATINEVRTDVDDWPMEQSDVPLLDGIAMLEAEATGEFSVDIFARTPEERHALKACIPPLFRQKHLSDPYESGGSGTSRIVDMTDLALPQMARGRVQARVRLTLVGAPIDVDDRGDSQREEWRARFSIVWDAMVTSLVATDTIEIVNNAGIGPLAE